MKQFAPMLPLALILVICPSVISDVIRYDRGDRRDPFIPLVTAEGVVNQRNFNADDIRIEGIIYDPGGGSMVLINGEFYKQGDNVSGANVISIFRDRVILSKADEEKTLWIREEIVNSGEKNVQPKAKPASNVPRSALVNKKK